MKLYLKKYIIILFAFIGSFVNAQGYDFQELCLACAEQNGYYCGDDPTNWTQYAPDGCVINGWLNDGWEDCVDATDENGAVPTSPDDCAPPPSDCDTVYVEIPVIEYEYIYETDTIIEEVEVPFYIYETIIQLDTIIQTEYIDCDTGMPCNSSIQEILDKSENDGRMYNILGQPIRRPQSIYIQDGKIKYIMN